MRPRIARICEKLGAAAGIISTLVVVLVGVISQREALSSDAAHLGGAWLGTFLAAPCGMLFALVALSLFAFCRRMRGASDNDAVVANAAFADAPAPKAASAPVWQVGGAG